MAVFGTPIMGAHGGDSLARLARVTQQATAAWRRGAACKGLDPALFYPVDPETDEVDAEAAVEAEAKEICAGCPVREACLEHAIAVREQHGVWGGLSARERRREIRRRKRAA